MEKTIYNLELHETFEIEYYLSCTRVPGGWIYNHSGEFVFVPYNGEFKPEQDLKNDLPIW